MVAERQLIPFLNIAYQGFGDGLEQDAYAVRKMVLLGLPFLLSNYFSNIFSRYSERVGELSIVCDSANEAERVLGQLKPTVRRNYSSPPNFGAQVVAQVLNEPALKVALPEDQFDYLLCQRGMFSYTCLSPAQVAHLREFYGVYTSRH